MSYVVSFEQLRMTDVDSVGGKNASLGEMISQLAGAGVRVPGDIALAGFDDIPLARFVHPSLTTMRVSIAALGERALARLLEQIEAGADGAETAGAAAGAAQVMVPELVVRESSGREAARAQARRGRPGKGRE